MINRRRHYGRRKNDEMTHFLVWLRERTIEVFFDSDATTIRVLLAVGSFWLAVILWSPTHPFERPAYSWMVYVANETWWGVAFMAHTIGVIWRIYDPKPRVYWALAVNTYGAFIWTFAEACLTLSIGEIAPARALDWSLILASWVALYRTGLNEGKGTP